MSDTEVHRAGRLVAIRVPAYRVVGSVLEIVTGFSGGLRQQAATGVFEISARHAKEVIRRGERPGEEMQTAH